MEKLSTLIITYNEERNIERCLRSVLPISDEVLVVDSNSTDRTVEIAVAHGARVITRDWPGYGRQKQFAVEAAANNWIFSVDADEEISPALADEIRNLDFSKNGYEVPRRVWYLGRWITHGVWYPGYVLRMFRRDRGRFTDEIVHESADVPGPIGRFRNDIYHYSYRSVAHHVDKINDFTTLAARQMHGDGRSSSVAKIALYPTLEFLKVYFQKRGFLDGLAGLAVSLLHSYYVFLKYLKLYELQIGAGEADGGREAHDDDDKAVGAGG